MSVICEPTCPKIVDTHEAKPVFVKSSTTSKRSCILRPNFESRPVECDQCPSTVKYGLIRKTKSVLLGLNRSTIKFASYNDSTDIATAYPSSLHFRIISKYSGSFAPLHMMRRCFSSLRSALIRINSDLVPASRP